MSTTKTQRIISLVLALFLLGSAFGAVFYYVAQNKQQAKQEKELLDLQNQINQQSQQQPTPTPTPTEVENMLQGTQLANFTPISSTAELQTIDLTEGTGEVVPAGASVTVNYTGAVASTGVIFQSSLDIGQPVTFGLDGVIAGWTQGIPGMKVGGTRRLVIPASLAYGANPPASSGIPANADLVFDVDLISIN